jgi:hypothetical protein
MRVAVAGGELHQAQPVAALDQPHRLAVDGDRGAGIEAVRQIALIQSVRHANPLVARRVAGIGAQERTRTSTPIRALAPEASASTSSATWAGVVRAAHTPGPGLCQRADAGVFRRGPGRAPRTPPAVRRAAPSRRVLQGIGGGALPVPGNRRCDNRPAGRALRWLWPCQAAPPWSRFGMNPTLPDRKTSFGVLAARILGGLFVQK